MSNKKEINDVPIGTVVIISYEGDGEVFTEEAVLVDNYVINKLVLKIKAGCTSSSYKEEELFIFETPKTKRFVLTKDEFIYYEKIRLKKYKDMNYQKLKVGKRVKLIGNIRGVQDKKDVKSGVFGVISAIYQNIGDIKMASIIVNDIKTKKEKEIQVPLVNCIAIGK